MLINLIYNSVCGYWQPLDIILRVISILVYLGNVYFYNKVFKKDLYLWLHILLLSFILLIENLSVAFGENKETEFSYSFDDFNVYFSMILLTVLSSSQGFRFFHIFVLCLFSIIVSIVNMGLIGTFEITILYELFYYMLILFRKYLTLRECYDNYIQMINYEKRNK
jgi:hypothetical protein